MRRARSAAVAAGLGWAAALGVALGVAAPTAHAGAFHFLDFEGGFTAAFQSGGDSESGYLAYTPAWEIVHSFGLKLKAGAAPYRATTATIFFAFDGQLLLTFRPLEWLIEDGGPSAIQLEAGGGIDYWAVVGGLPFPSFTGQISYHFDPRLLWVFERVVVGYRYAMLSGVPTHVVYGGIGLRVF